MKTYHSFRLDKLSGLSLTGCILSILASASTALAAPPVTLRASVSSSGIEGNSLSQYPDVSANGRFVAFESNASNLVPGDTNNWSDVIVRDLKTGTTRRVSLNSAGIQANHASSAPALSANGRFVAFDSSASNLDSADNNDWTDVYVRDLKTGVTQLVSVSNSGNAANYYSASPDISADGRFVAFYSGASNLVVGDTNGVEDVYVRDLKTGVTQRVSVNSQGAQAAGGELGSGGAALSANGRFVAFHSEATNLVPGDNNGVDDIFVHNLKTGVTQRVSLNSDGVEASGGTYGSFGPAISANGRFVSFTSDASNLVPNDNNDTYDVFVRDLKNGTTRRVSVDSAGNEGNYGGGSFSAISGNGRFVAFESVSDNLVQEDNNFWTDIFVHDLTTGATQRVSVSSSGTEACCGIFGSYYPAISDNGRIVAFQSDASNLVDGDTNHLDDIFVHKQ